MTSAYEESGPAGNDWLFSDTFFNGFFALVGILMLAFGVFFVWMLVRNLRLIRRADRAVADGQGRPGAGYRAAPAPAASLEQRLLELDDLHRRGVISGAEHAQARQRVLTGD